MLQERTPACKAPPVADPGRSALARAFTGLLDRACGHGMEGPARTADRAIAREARPQTWAPQLQQAPRALER
jgi:hypothetical protein